MHEVEDEDFERFYLLGEVVQVLKAAVPSEVADFVRLPLLRDVAADVSLLEAAERENRRKFELGIKPSWHELCTGVSDPILRAWIRLPSHCVRTSFAYLACAQQIQDHLPHELRGALARVEQHGSLFRDSAELWADRVLAEQLSQLATVVAGLTLITMSDARSRSVLDDLDRCASALDMGVRPSQLASVHEPLLVNPALLLTSEA